MTEQRTTPEMRAELRDRHALAPVPVCSICGGKMVIKAYEDRQVCWECRGCGVFSWTSDGDIAVLAAVDDADALAEARAECERLRAALAFVLDEMEGCEGRQGMWEDGIDPDYRRAIERGRAALAPGTGGATDGNG